METITWLLVAFILVGLAWPNTVKNRGMLFLAILAVLVTMVFSLFAGLVAREPRWTVNTYLFLWLILWVLQIIALVLLILAFGGLTLAELVHEIGAGFRSIGREQRGFPVMPPPVPSGERNDQPRP